MKTKKASMKSDSSLTHVTSWVIVSKATGLPVLETFNPKVAKAINLEKYRVLSSLEWLQEFNANCAVTMTRLIERREQTK